MSWWDEQFQEERKCFFMKGSVVDVKWVCNFQVLRLWPLKIVLSGRLLNYTVEKNDRHVRVISKVMLTFSALSHSQTVCRLANL